MAASSFVLNDTFPCQPIVTKLYCNDSWHVTLGIRRRPLVVNGGGLVVTDSSQRIVFRVDGSGAELILRDSAGQPLMFICRKGGFVQVLSVKTKWKGYRCEYDGSMEPVFTLKETDLTRFSKRKTMKITTSPRRSKKDWDFQVRGSFPDRACSIVDHDGAVVAQICSGDPDERIASGNDVYRVVMTPLMDQAFVVAVIAVLDNIHGGWTTG